MHQNIFLGLMELPKERDDGDEVDIDGEPLEECIDGVPLEQAKQIFENPEEEYDEDVDGVPLDEIEEEKRWVFSCEQWTSCFSNSEKPQSGFRPAAFKPAMQESSEDDDEERSGHSPSPREEKKLVAPSFRLATKSKWEAEVVRSPTPSTDGEIDEPRR